MTENSKNKPWGGRFSEATDQFVEQFTASVEFDQRMWAQDIEGSRAHAKMLASVGVIKKAECDQILAGLDQIQQQIEAGTFEWQVSLEDVHMNIEARLVALIGEPGKKLHTGRSRNDQVATDLRLYLRAAVDQLDQQLQAVQIALIDLAEREADTLMPGFTHLQVAQVVSLGHHLLAWFEMLVRDRARLQDCRKRVNVMPLGSAALAGTGFPLDRNMTAASLGFEEVSANSLDAVSDRDFAIEFCAAAAISMTHFSRMSEELILWASQQFDFIDLPDRFCTGSSIMPQKKNPDVPELVRGKTGRVCGHLMSLLMLMKGQPLAYNKDNQEDKEPLFDAIDTMTGVYKAFADMLPSIEFKRDNLCAAANRGYATATDLADYLVRKGLPFRDAHEVVGQLVKTALDRNCMLSELALADMQTVCSSIGADVFDVLTIDGSVASKLVYGGASPKNVRDQVERARKRV